MTNNCVEWDVKPIHYYYYYYYYSYQTQMLEHTSVTSAAALTC